jgi:GTP-binding protein SAR1
MFIFNWFGKFLVYFGFYKRSIKIVFLGLDNAGKTTMLNLLKDSKVTHPLPTLHPYSNEIQINGINFITYDLGGHSQGEKINISLIKKY